MATWKKFGTNVRRHGITDTALVFIGIQPYRSNQATERDYILNICHFSGAEFNIVSSFLSPDGS
jgi:hypothetical protein